MKILLVRVSSMGDVLHNMPVVDDLLRHFPEAEIDWVVEEAYVNMVKLHRGVRRIIPFALRRWRKSLLSRPTRQEIKNFFTSLRREQYDLVLDTQGLLKTGAIMGLARTVNGGKKVGLANGTEGSGYEAASRIFHTESVAVDRHTHAVLRGRLVAAHAGGYAVDTPASFGMHAPDLGSGSVAPAWMPAQDYAVFYHGTARSSKKWAQDNWVEAAKTVAEYRLPILLPWGNAAEQREAEQLAARIPSATVLPQLSMLEAVALSQRAALVVGVDTGLTHIAAAYERPTVEIYCDSPRWKTEGNWSRKIINLGDVGRPPTVQEVQQAVRSLLTKQADTG
ncbi:lipopolysaccharide heptosyltransferase I [Undibacterium sp.]|uniref:lipopolysaccharide heptosyltransferase I n=1 Tax=Undibacterium sp. TaxID=1914977 RepID=UPI002C666630|nr:lipopolysaccharide heptosyltransferase I [Undibacterium sp.]HTD06130.1 lipopolysaccharide heptosyltransferase I [Undibacterium sp.]